MPVALASQDMPESVIWPVRVHAYASVGSTVDHDSLMDEIENQGTECGSCWAYTVTSLIEARIAQQSGQRVALSPRHLLDCTSGFVLNPEATLPNQLQNQGCSGGYIKKTVEYLISSQTLICTEKSYARGLTWNWDARECNKRSEYCEKIVNVTEAELVTLNGEAKLKSMVAQGPTGVAMRVDSNFKNFKGGSIYNNDVTICNCELSSCECHAVVVTGYGTDNSSGVDYWIVANSWGTGWGDSGYAKIKRGDNLLGIESLSAVKIDKVILSSEFATPHVTTTTKTPTGVVVDVNVYDEPKSHTHANSDAAPAIVAMVLLFALLASVYCAMWPTSWESNSHDIVYKSPTHHYMVPEPVMPQVRTLGIIIQPQEKKLSVPDSIPLAQPWTPSQPKPSAPPQKKDDDEGGDEPAVPDFSLPGFGSNKFRL